LYFYRARYYDAELWRFISQDPIGIKDDINLYNYVGGNPVNWADPLGLEKSLLSKITDNLWDLFLDGVQNVWDWMEKWGNRLKKNTLDLSAIWWTVWAVAWGFVWCVGGWYLLLPSWLVVFAPGVCVESIWVWAAAWAVAWATVWAWIGSLWWAIAAIGKEIKENRRWTQNEENKRKVKKWQENHKNYDAKDYDKNPTHNYDYEKPTPSKKWRVDAIDKDNKIIRELKPNNPRAIKKWEKQLERYIKDFKDDDWWDRKWFIDTYEN